MSARSGDRDHAIVVGASMAGLFAARVLSEAYGRVTVLERGQLPEGPEPRKTVPQGRHVHVFLPAGIEVVDRLFPELVDRLVDDGAVLADVSEDGIWYAGGYRLRNPSGLPKGPLMSRPLLEHHVRTLVAERPNVDIRSGVRVSALRAGSTGRRVTGVEAEGPSADGLEASLVVDATGRASRAPQWLDDLGYEAPSESEVRVDVGYTTGMFRRGPDDLPGGARFAAVIPEPPETRAATLFPIEGDRWLCTMVGFHGDHAPSEPEGYREFARSLPTPVVADVVASAEPLAPLAIHRFASTRRRHFEKLRRVPAGFVAIGDAVCSFNPIYGQGMSTAALQALALADVVTPGSLESDQLARHFYRRVAKGLANAWQLAVGADFAHPATEGKKPPGTDLVNRYVARAMRATQRSPRVNRAMFAVQGLMAPPSSIMKPSVMLDVFRASRGAPVVTPPAADRSA